LEDWEARTPLLSPCGRESECLRRGASWGRLVQKGLVLLSSGVTWLGIWRRLWVSVHPCLKHRGGGGRLSWLCECGQAPWPLCAPSSSADQAVTGADGALAATAQVRAWHVAGVGCWRLPRFRRGACAQLVAHTLAATLGKWGFEWGLLGEVLCVLREDSTLFTLGKLSGQLWSHKQRGPWPLPSTPPPWQHPPCRRGMGLPSQSHSPGS